MVVKHHKPKQDKGEIPRHVLQLSAEIKANAKDWSIQQVYKKQLYLNARSWQAWADAAVPEAADLKGHLQSSRKFDSVKLGDRFVLHKMIMPHIDFVTEMRWFTLRSFWTVHSLPLSRYGQKYGYVYFDDDVVIPILADSRLQPWMSPTPSEVMSQRQGIRVARGHVLVAGLGMGWLAKEILRKKGVKSVTVVERDLSIAAFFGPGMLCAPGAKAHPIRVDDFYATSLDGFDSVIADIWESAGNAGDDQRFQRMKRDLTARGVRVWGWGDYCDRG